MSEVSAPSKLKAFSKNKTFSIFMHSVLFFQKTTIEMEKFLFYKKSMREKRKNKSHLQRLKKSWLKRWKISTITMSKNILFRLFCKQIWMKNNKMLQAFHCNWPRPDLNASRFPFAEPPPPKGLLRHSMEQKHLKLWVRKPSHMSVWRIKWGTKNTTIWR